MIVTPTRERIVNAQERDEIFSASRPSAFEIEGVVFGTDM
jgi:hypothetical protein